MFTYKLLLLLALLGNVSVYGQESTADTLNNVTVPATDNSAASKSEESIWDAANTAYINADYHHAIEYYLDLIHKGYQSDKLYFNLANAYFKSGHHAKAILYYNRALRINPGDADIRYNLEVTNTYVKDKIQVVPEFFLKSWIKQICSTLGCTTWSVLSLVALALIFVCILTYLLAGRLLWRKIGFYGTLLWMVLFVVTTSFAWVERQNQLDVHQAVIMSSSVAVKSSPDNSSTDLFVLHEGTLVRTISELGEWREITIADGKKGWVEQDAIEVI
jgi:tetratricopeptide (TPR) repeat protein